MVVDVAKAMVGFARLFRPRYAVANLGHPSYSSDLAMTWTPQGPDSEMVGLTHAPYGSAKAM